MFKKLLYLFFPITTFSQTLEEMINGNTQTTGLTCGKCQIVPQSGQISLPRVMCASRSETCESNEVCRLVNAGSYFQLGCAERPSDTWLGLSETQLCIPGSLLHYCNTDMCNLNMLNSNTFQLNWQVPSVSENTIQQININETAVQLSWAYPNNCVALMFRLELQKQYGAQLERVETTLNFIDLVNLEPNSLYQVFIYTKAPGYDRESLRTQYVLVSF